MLKYAVLIFLLFISFELHAITLIESKPYKINGVQIFNFDKKYKYHLDEYFKTLKQFNVNTVFVRVFQNSTDRIHFNKETRCKSGVYFHSDSACTVFDILSYIIPYAKKYDIKVFAWMATRSLSFLKDEYGYELEFRNKRLQNGYGVNIFDGRVRDKMIKLFQELASYDIDGILIQDDFILRMNEGLSDITKRRYFVDYGKFPRENDIDWYKWKLKNLSNLLDKIRYETKKINPNIKFAVNIYYETPIYKKNGIKWYAQSIQRYKNLQFFYYAVMAYHEQIMSELKIEFNGALIYIDNMLKSLTKVLKPENIAIKIQVRKFNRNKDRISESKINKLCNVIKKYNTGIVLVPFESLSDLKNSCFR